MQSFKVFLLVVILTCCSGGSVGPSLAQSPLPTRTSQQSAGNLSFDAATVHAAKPPVPVSSLFPLGPDDAYVQTGGRFEATDNLLHFIAFAYKLQPRQIMKLAHDSPPWVHLTPFKIEAHTSRPSVAKDEMRQMMQSLLADQFHLVIRQEIQPYPMLELTVSDARAANRNLKPHVDKGRCAKSVSQAASNGDCGSVVVSFDCPENCKKIRAKGISMIDLAEYLTKQTDLGTVVDRTGLTGKYDFRLEWDATGVTPYNDAPIVGSRVPPGASVAGGDNPLAYVADRPHIEKALKEELGLTLVRSAARGEVYAIDRVVNPE